MIKCVNLKKKSLKSGQVYISLKHQEPVESNNMGKEKRMLNPKVQIIKEKIVPAMGGFAIPGRNTLVGTRS